MRSEEDLRRAMADTGARLPGPPLDARQAVTRRARRQRAARLAPLAAVAVAAVAFGVVRLTATSDRKTPLVVTNPAPGHTPEPTTLPPPTPTTHAQVAGGGCTTSHLRITAQQGSGAGGHGNVVIAFRNTGASCQLAGFPGVAAVDANGAQLAQARRTSTGFFGGLRSGAVVPPTVTLARGDVASAILEGLNASQPGGGPCPAYAGLVVTPPAEKASAHVSVAFAMCDLEIHPVVPGSDGGAGTTCPDYAFRPQSSDTATDVTAFATTCAVAHSVVAGGPDVGQPKFGTDYVVAGFTCKADPQVQPPGGGEAFWPYNCTDSHGAAVTFSRHA